MLSVPVSDITCTDTQKVFIHFRLHIEAIIAAGGMVPKSCEPFLTFCTHFNLAFKLCTQVVERFRLRGPETLRLDLLLLGPPALVARNHRAELASSPSFLESDNQEATTAVATRCCSSNTAVRTAPRDASSGPVDSRRDEFLPQLPIEMWKIPNVLVVQQRLPDS